MKGGEVLYLLFVWYCQNTGSIQTGDICLLSSQRTETEETHFGCCTLYFRLEALLDITVGDPNL